MGYITAYVDFNSTINGVSTDFKIYETPTHLFVYISQNTNSIVFEEHILGYLRKMGIKKRKKHVVFCELKDHNSLENVNLTLLHIFSEKLI